MSQQPPTIVVTGAGGFLGSACCRRFFSSGMNVRALVHRPQAHPGLTAIAPGGVFQYDLEGQVDPHALTPPVHTVIHCAYSMSGIAARSAPDANISGTIRLFDECNRSGVEHIVFISSMAAHAGARSAYGRSKWQLEFAAAKRSASIVRPGTIIGSGGLFAQLRSAVRRAPVIPLFYGDRRLQTVYIDDLVEAIFQIVSRRVGGTFNIAEAQGIRIANFYRAIALLEDKHARLVRFPGNLALLALQLAEAAHLRLPISSDNLLGLKHLQRFDAIPSLQLLQVCARGFWDSMSALASSEGNTQAVQSIDAMRRERSQPDNVANPGG